MAKCAYIQFTYVALIQNLMRGLRAWIGVFWLSSIICRVIAFRNNSFFIGLSRIVIVCSALLQTGNAIC